MVCRVESSNILNPAHCVNRPIATALALRTTYAQSHGQLTGAVPIFVGTHEAAGPAVQKLILAIKNEDAEPFARSVAAIST